MDPVECLASASFPGTPVAFTWQGTRLLVAEVLSRGHTPSGFWFRVRASAGAVFELEYHQPDEDCRSAVDWQVKPL